MRRPIAPRCRSDLLMSRLMHNERLGHSLPRWGKILCWLFVLYVAREAVAADDTGGEKIYRELCARCHGTKGEGSEDHKKPLIGDRSVAQLAKYIAKSM